MTRRHAIWIHTAIIVAVFSMDRITKSFFFDKPTHQIFPVILATTQHRNFGLIANLPVPSGIIIAFTMIVLAIIGWKIIEQTTVYRLPSTVFPLALIAGGALGNLYDRLTMGFVFDWIWIFQRSVINLADVAIGIGICWFLLAQTHHEKSSV